MYLKLKLPSSAPELARVPLRSFGAAAHIHFPYVTLTICSHRLLHVSQVEPAVRSAPELCGSGACGVLSQRVRSSVRPVRCVPSDLDAPAPIGWRGVTQRAAVCCRRSDHPRGDLGLFPEQPLVEGRG